MAGDKVGRVDQIGTLDRGLAESQVGHGETAGFLGVIGEITLRIHVCMVADDLDGVLVSADGAVRTETEELAGDRSFRSGVDLFGDLQREMRHVVFDTDREVILRFALLEVLIYGVDHGRSEFLAAETVSSAVYLDVSPAAFDQRVDEVLIKRFTERAGLFRSVKHRNAFAGRGNRGNKAIHGERTVQTDFQQTVFLAARVQVIDRLFADIRAAAHDDDHVLSVGSADIIEQMIGTSGQFADFVHVFLYDFRNCVIVLVRGFSSLEVDIRVLSGTALMRMLRVQSSGTERLDRVTVEQFVHVLVIDRFDLLDFMGSTESVEEMKERYRSFDRGKMRDERKIHNFLYGRGSEHRKSGLTACHHVTVIAEDRKSMRGKRTSADMKYAGKQFARDLVHVGDHQKKSLRCGESRGKRAGFQRSVNCACGAAF